MGRFKQKYIIIRQFEKLSIVFWDAHSIYVFPNGFEKFGYVFHNWYAPIGSYSSGWRQFRLQLLRSKAPDFNYCCRMAGRYEVLSSGHVGVLDFNKKLIEIRYSNWRIKGIGAK